MNLTYTVCVYPAEKATCQCLDFLTHDNACKHLRAAILCINWIRQEPANQYLPHISLPTVEELYTQVDDNTEENIQNEINNIEELNIQIQRNQSDESEESNKEYKNLESSQLNDDNLSSTWFFDFQNTNSLALQEQEFHINCHSVLNHLNSLKEISKLYKNLIIYQFLIPMKIVKDLLKEK